MGCLGLTLITFGIYGIYWWYKANTEAQGYDPSIQGTQPCRRWPSSSRSPVW